MTQVRTFESNQKKLRKKLREHVGAHPPHFDGQNANSSAVDICTQQIRLINYWNQNRQEDFQTD